MRWARQVANLGDLQGVWRDLVGSPEGRRLLGKLRSKWEDNDKINF